MLEFFLDYKMVFVFVHLVAIALGVGGATISDVLFFRYLKDSKISPKERETLLVLSNVIWFAILLFLISGFALFIPNKAELLQSSKFLVKMVVVSVIILNGFFLNIVITPRLSDVASCETRGMGRMRRLAIASGAISITSWYSALILGMAGSIPLEFWPLLSIYLDFLVVAIAGSQIFERLKCAR